MFCKRFSPTTGREEWCLMEEDYDDRRDILRYYLGYNLFRIVSLLSQQDLPGSDLCSPMSALTNHKVLLPQTSFTGSLLYAPKSLGTRLTTPLPPVSMMSSTNANQLESTIQQYARIFKHCTPSLPLHTKNNRN